MVLEANERPRQRKLHFLVAVILSGHLCDMLHELKILAHFPVLYFPPHSIPSLAFPLVHDTGTVPSKMLTPVSLASLVETGCSWSCSTALTDYKYLSGIRPPGL